MMIEHNTRTQSQVRERFIVLLVFIASALFFIALSVGAATIISSTKITIETSLGVATSSPWGTLSVEQTSGGLQSPVFVVGDQGTSSPHIFINQRNNNHKTYPRY